MKAAATPSKRNLLSKLIAQGNITPIRHFANKYRVPESAVKEANAAVDYGVMAGEPSNQLKKREAVETVLEKSQPLATQLIRKFGFGGARKLKPKTKKHKKPKTKKYKKPKTKKLMIPSEVAEPAIEILTEIALGGRRRKTRKNK
jgi:hypothetical protein